MAAPSPATLLMSSQQEKWRGKGKAGSYLLRSVPEHCTYYFHSTTNGHIQPPWRLGNVVFSWVTVCFLTFSSVQFSCSVVSGSLQPHESQHARPPCPSPTPRVYSNLCPLNPWCHPASVVPHSSCPQSFPASGSFLMSQLFTWGGRSMEFQLQRQSFQWTPRTHIL